jgi:hypothetical protein
MSRERKIQEDLQTLYSTKSNRLSEQKNSVLSEISNYEKIIEDIENSISFNPTLNDENSIVDYIQSYIQLAEKIDNAKADSATLALTPVCNNRMEVYIKGGTKEKLFADIETLAEVTESHVQGGNH